MIDIIDTKTPKKRPPSPSRWRWQAINDVTIKLYMEGDEESTTPASHGQWGGYRTPKALAYVICLGPNAWMARCDRRATELKSLSEAKADAISMVKANGVGHIVRDQVHHFLAALQAANPDE